MKRSLMLEKIRAIVAENCDPKYYDVTCEVVAEQILNTIEDIMKPPVEKLCPVLLTKRYMWEKEEG